MSHNQIEIVEVAESHKTILRQLLELYEYDFSEFTGADVNAYGHYGYRYLDHYWTDDGRSVYFVKVDDQYAGFVMVNGHCYLSEDDDSRSIAEFFIMRKYRRQGIGKQVAFEVFDKHAGYWEVRQHGNNLPSHAFWKSTVHDYTAGNYTEHEVTTEHWQGKGLLFRK